MYDAATYTYDAPPSVPKFTAKERDSETGLDYFGARYFSSVNGRFTTSDLLMAGAVLANPQTWNRYVYALNNPLRFIDPDGLVQEDVIKLKVVVYLSDQLTKKQLKQVDEQLRKNAERLKKIGIEQIILKKETIDFKEFIKSTSNATSGAVNVAFGTNEDFSGSGSGSDIKGGRAGVFINIAKQGDDDSITTFEFVQVLTLNENIRSGNFFQDLIRLGANAVKDIAFTPLVTEALKGDSENYRKFVNFVTFGGISEIKENAKKYQVDQHKQEQIRPPKE